MTHGYRILIGACGWTYPAWQENFYPEDLPEDWQLGYYSNEFPVVLLSADKWRQIKDEDMDWLEDCNDELAIITEIPSEYLDLEMEQATQMIDKHLREQSVLGPRHQAAVLRVHKLSNELESLLVNIQSAVPICIEPAEDLLPEAINSIQKMCEKHGWPLVWHGDDEGECFSFSSLAIGRVKADAKDLRGLRHIVETMLTKTDVNQTCILLFDGQPPAIEAIRNANVILDLF